MTTRRSTEIGKATFGAGQTLSSAVNIAGVAFVGFLVGAGKTGADFTLQTSIDGATWNDAYDDAGTQVKVLDANSPSGRVVSLGEKVAPYALIRFVASVAQAAGLTITVFGKS